MLCSGCDVRECSMTGFWEKVEGFCLAILCINDFLLLLFLLARATEGVCMRVF